MKGTWRSWLFAIAALALLAVALPFGLYSSRLPDPIATHWAASGAPNGSTAKRFALVIPAALIGGALLLSLMGAARAPGAGRTVRVGLLTLVGGVAATAGATIVERNLDKAAWTDADSLMGGLLALQIGLPLAAAALASTLAWRAWRHLQPPAAAPPGSRMRLAAGARAFWSGGASNRWLLGIGIYVLLQGILAQVLLPQLRVAPIALAVHIAVFIALVLFARIRVTIDGRGVAVRYGVVGLWTQRVPLERIVGAQAVDLDPLAHGGWGYRGGLTLFRKVAIVVRAGDALRLDLSSGRQLFITVDDAATAAQLLNALLERQPPAHGTAEVTPRG